MLSLENDIIKAVKLSISGSEVLSKITLVTLPIGNLEDITKRAMEKLAQAKWVLAEDTRSFRKLCDFLGISCSEMMIESFHDHNVQKVGEIIDKINARAEVVLVSDAGSPIISDPAFPLINAAIENNIEIDTIPGVSSVIVALELSGLPAHPFCFHGFLPREKNKKQELFLQCHERGMTHIYFESPHRIVATLDTLSEMSVEFNVAVCRELTKKFQTVYRFSSKYWDEQKENFTEKGEFVLLLYPVEQNTQKFTSSEIEKLAREVLDKKGHSKSVAKLVAKILDINTKEIYSEMSRK